MCDGYHAAGEDDHPDLEDEFLCEYVDGTMDPVVQEVFEEYVRTDPDLQEHIRCLRDTRLLLCTYGCRCHAPRDLQDRLRREITCELMDGQVPFHIILSDRVKGAASVSSAMAILLLIGFLGGLTAMDAGDGNAPLMSTAVISVQDFRPMVTVTRIDGLSRSVVQTPPLSPRDGQFAVLRSAEPLVVRGIEHELRRGNPASYLAALDRSLAYP